MVGRLFKASLGALFLGASVAALGQTGWAPGSEITGQSVQVETNGVTNTVYVPRNSVKYPQPFF